MSAANKKEKNYRIFRVEEPKGKSKLPKKITMIRIYAKDNEDAYKQLIEYRKAANKAYTYYVERWCPITVIRDDGTKRTYDDFTEELEDYRNSKPFYVRWYDNVTIFLWRIFVNPLSNFRYWVRDTVYLLRHKQTYESSWTIDDRLLDVLLFNIPILKKYKHTLSWKMLDKAILEKHKDEKDFDLQKFYETHYSGYGDDIEDASVKYEHEMFDNLIADIQAYKYLMNEEYLDNNFDNPIDKALRPTLPLIKGSYDNYDGKKLLKMCDKYWNRIWETVRIYGREFND